MRADAPWGRRRAGGGRPSIQKALSPSGVFPHDPAMTLVASTQRAKRFADVAIARARRRAQLTRPFALIDDLELIILTPFALERLRAAAELACASGHARQAAIVYEGEVGGRTVLVADVLSRSGMLRFIEGVDEAKLLGSVSRDAWP